MIIVLEGADGVGKTYLAKELCKILGAKYIHAGYKFKDKQFTYHTAIIHEALAYVRKYNKPVIIDRWWISESVYSEVYRMGTNWPLMGRYMDRILHKVGGVYIFCLHDGSLDDYCKRFNELKFTRYEMYKDTRDVANIYEGLWKGTYTTGFNTYANQISEHGGFCKRFNCLKYSINKEGKDIPSFCHQIITRMEKPSILFSDNFTGDLLNSDILFVGDELCNIKKGKLSWPFHKYSDSGLFMTQWLHDHNMTEQRIAWVNIYEKNGKENILSWLVNHTTNRKVICLGDRALTTFKRFYPRIDCYPVIHPSAAAKFPFNRDTFNNQLECAILFTRKGK